MADEAEEADGVTERGDELEEFALGRVGEWVGGWVGGWVEEEEV